MRISDWSSYVCSSDLPAGLAPGELRRALLDEGLGALLGVVGREDRCTDSRVVLPAVVLVLALGVAHGPEDGLDRQRAVRGDLVGDLGCLGQRMRSDERRVGTECGSTCRSRWSR